MAKPSVAVREIGHGPDLAETNRSPEFNNCAPSSLDPAGQSISFEFLKADSLTS